MENLQQERLLPPQELHQEDKETPKSEASDHQKSKSTDAVSSSTAEEPMTGSREERIEEEKVLESSEDKYLTAQEYFQCVVTERDALRRELDAQKSETRALYAEVLELEKQNEEREIELRQVRRERDGLLGEKRWMERRLETVMEESASIVSSLIAVQSDLEEQMARKMRDGRISTGRAISILKNAGRMIGISREIKEEDGGSEFFVDGRDEIGEEIVRKFAVGFEAIDRNFRSKLEKMEEMKRKVESLKGCVEEEMRKKRCS